MRTARQRRFRIVGPNVRRALVAAALVAGLTTISTGTSYAVQFCNTTPINGTGAFGPLSVYPSAILVSGLSGTVTDVNVTLRGLTTQADPNNFHWVEDLDVMVAGPSGATAVAMSDAGGNNDDVQPALSNVNLTLDDQAANQLPADSALSSGNWRPVDDDTEHSSETRPVDEWAAPAPPPPSGSSFTVFNGTNPNGTWNLWAMDDTQLAVNGFNGGWCIDILTTGGATTTSATGATTTSSSTPLPTTTSSSSSSTTSTTGLPASTCTAPPPATIRVQPGVPTFGTPGNDVIYGTAGNDRIFGLGGNDIIVGLGGDDQIGGGDGNDVLCGGPGNDYLLGEAGSDLLVGDAGNDFLTGDAGNDRLIGGLDADRLSGGSDVDTCTSGGQAGDFSAPPPDCDTIT